MARARKPAPPKPAAEPKKSVRDSLSWKLARVDLPCGHSVTRLPGRRTYHCHTCPGIKKDE